ncbi:cytochrome P450 [Variovorax saccharolyticus]|uniref:cytochrome P450 n=1 Tax=Variovorax saccharolyticus TaxID=3053516 RepID=UPI0025761679|nr:cytochrome P450 [Variovorax sp. J31P216]MDM0026187.1 cytochrome P450 [Variovorax sp. J31P216]
METLASRRIADLPGPRGAPLIGNLLQIDAARMHQQLEQWCREFGPYFKLQMGRRKILIVGDHEAVAMTLRDRPEGFKRSVRLQAVASEMGLQPGLFGANGEDWRRQRRMVMASFDPAHVRHYFPSLQKVAERLVGRWQAAARSGEAIDLQADLMRYTVDTIAGLAFGAEVNTLESDGDVIQQHLDKIFPALLKRMLAPLPTWRLLPTAADRELKRGVLAVNEAVAGFIAEARSRMAADPTLRTQPRNLLEAMIAAADEPGSGITDQQVAGNVLTMLLAGEDTTANTIAWMIDLLWRHPEALQRATAEVRGVLGDTRCPSLEQLAQLDFVEACTHETMRLKPVAPILALQAERDTRVGDVQVPAGTVVIDLMRIDSVSDGHLSNAAAFEPGRWLADGPAGAMAGRAKRISMPFGAGPRMCPGRYLALLEMKMAMAQLLNSFDLASVGTPDGSPAREHLSFTMTPIGLRMRLRERQHERG